jgi:hypothetical protein
MSAQTPLILCLLQTYCLAVDQHGSVVSCSSASLSRNAGQAGLLPMTVRTSTHELLIRQGYKLIDDARSLSGRLTYDHNDDATREFIASLAKVLGSLGWETHPNILRAFRHRNFADEVIEIEPGGAETSGHFIHYMKTD